MSKGPQNSVISDPAPFLPPDAPKKPTRPKASDWARLGKSRKYKGVDQMMEARKEYWRHFTPDGESFTMLYAKDPDAATRFAVIAAEVIKEIDDIQYRIQVEASA